MKAQKDRLYEDVRFLTEIRPYRNYLNVESLEKVCAYTKDAFNKAGLTVEEQKWTVDGREYKNIIATYNKSPGKRLIVGAHYDVCGDQPGADDNASAVAGLLETARLTGESQPEIDYQIDFVAYCLEEPPFFGSQEMGSFIHAKSLYDDGVEVMGMICYEMIGYFSDEPNSQPFPSPELAKLYPSTANFIIVVGIDSYADFNQRIKSLMAGNSKIDVQVISFPSKAGLAGLSDQRNYWHFGYPALMINDTSFIRNPNYHLKSDTIETLNFDKMTEVINGSFNAIINLA
ncbi:M28 family peptidase [Nafulsella turpanensis]|uniref:M28 family peptidase n=1 Tax=Nafulsella turpanensis TaxID=1265690 RepID=UPI00034C4421|nr:M28 family peptidase [Nafulsella turpanensis]